MFKLQTYYEKEKLPTIYSPNAPLKSLSQKRRINYQNIFDQTFSGSIYDLNKNSLEKIKFLLKAMDNREKFNSVNNSNKIMTIYNKNNRNNSYNNAYNNIYNNNNQRKNYKSYNNQTNIQNKVLNETNIAFHDSYHNFLNNLKNKKLTLNAKQSKEITKDFDSNKLKPLILRKKYNTSETKLVNNIKIVNKKKEV